MTGETAAEALKTEEKLTMYQKNSVFEIRWPNGRRVAKATSTNPAAGAQQKGGRSGQTGFQYKGLLIYIYIYRD